MKVGDKFTTRNCGDIEILEKRKGQICQVKFMETGAVIMARENAIHARSVSDPSRKTVCGVGFLGHEGTGSVKDRKAYRRWHAMISRCYNKNSDKYRFYGARGVKVSEKWHNFQNYRKWFQENFREGLQIDKDLLGRDRPIYGENTCVCITPRMNGFARSPLKYKHNEEINDVGSGKYCVTVKCPEGYNKYIGLFDNPNEALIAYSDVKHSYFVDILESDWRSGMISKFTYEKLKSVSPVLFYEKATIK